MSFQSEKKHFGTVKTVRWKRAHWKFPDALGWSGRGALPLVEVTAVFWTV